MESLDSILSSIYTIYVYIANIEFSKKIFDAFRTSVCTTYSNIAWCAVKSILTDIIRRHILSQKAYVAFDLKRTWFCIVVARELITEPKIVLFNGNQSGKRTKLEGKYAFLFDDESVHAFESFGDQRSFLFSKQTPWMKDRA